MTGVDHDLLARAEQGAERALDLLKEKLDDSFWLKAVNLGNLAEATLIRRMAGGEKHLVVREVLERRLAAMKAEIAGPDPSPLEKLLADRIAFCWAHMDSQLNPGQYLLGNELTVLDLYVTVVSRFGPWRERFYEVAPRMTPVVHRVDAEPRLQAFWQERFPLE